MPALLTLQLCAVDVPVPLPFLGEGVRAFFYESLRHVRPDISAELHARDEYKPFALSEPRALRRPAGGAAASEGLWQVRCGCLEDGLEDAVAEAIWRRHATEQEVRFGPARFQLDNPPWRPVAVSTYQSLATHPPASSWRLQFVSPTAVTRRGVRLPAPVPGAVFSSLLLKWNALAPEPLRIESQLLDELEAAVALESMRGRTVTLRLTNHVEIGFVGEAGFRVLSRDPAVQQAVSTLARFAHFAGVGVKTTAGMGQVLVSDETGSNRRAAKGG